MTTLSPMGVGFFIFFQDRGGAGGQKPKATPKPKAVARNGWTPIPQEIWDKIEAEKTVTAIKSELVDTEIKSFFVDEPDLITPKISQLEIKLEAAEIKLIEIEKSLDKNQNALALILILANI